jgi:hypothetical protein
VRDEEGAAAKGSVTVRNREVECRQDWCVCSRYVDAERRKNEDEMTFAKSGRRATAVVLLLVLAASIPLAAIDGDKAAYFGGTHPAYAGAKDPIEGTLNTRLEDTLVLSPTKRDYAGQELRIPYQNVIDLEYGQKAGRRVGTAVATSILLGPIGLVSLFSKKRKHYLTIGYRDTAGKDQVAVIELGKDIVRTTLAIVETRSGKQIEYQDEEARKSSR